MHYKLPDGRIIKSENSALSTLQPNSIICSYISSLPDNLKALDLGCGKLRHSLRLYTKCVSLTLVDSTEQLTRTQVINGLRTTVKDYATEKLVGVACYDITEKEWKNHKYDFILCTNVLSAIPEIEMRREVLRKISHCLSAEGRALISIQYRNSYFSGYGNKTNAEKFLDGWIMKRGSTNTFYGLIQPDDLVKTCKEVGFSIITKKLKDGSVYLEVGKSNK